MSIQSFTAYSQGEESTLRRGPYQTSHLRGKEGLYAPLFLTILSLEPRASLRHTARTTG